MRKKTTSTDTKNRKSDADRRFIIAVPRELHRELKQVSALMNTTQQKAVGIALSAWLVEAKKKVKKDLASFLNE